MNNYIYIRETLDWERATHADLRDDAIRMLAQLWDEAFPLNFMQCRAAIKLSTMEFLRAIPDAQIVTQQPDSFVPEDIVLIADDDDWYRPDIFDLLRIKQVKDYDGAVWTDAVFGYHIVWQSSQEARVEECISRVKIRPLNDANAFSMIKTNNYALSGDFFSSGHGVADVASHEHAARILTAPDKKLLTLNTLLSLVNRHPCSYLVLNNSMGGAPTKEKLRALVARYVDAVSPDALQTEVAWAAEPMIAMRKLFSEIL